MAGPAMLRGPDGSKKTDWHEWFDDFDDYVAAEWTISETGSGTRAVGVGTRGGVLVVTNAAADNDLNTLQWSGATGGGTAETFKFVAAKRLYFGIRCKILEVIQSDFFAGLIITDTDLVGGITDGIYFRKDDGDNDLDFVVRKDSVSTNSPTAIYDMVADTYVELEFFYDGNGHWAAYVDGVAKGGVASATISPDDEELSITFGIQNGEGVANVLSVDWIRVIEER